MVSYYTEGPVDLGFIGPLEDSILQLLTGRCTSWLKNTSGVSVNLTLEFELG